MFLFFGQKHNLPCTYVNKYVYANTWHFVPGVTHTQPMSESDATKKRGRRSKSPEPEGQPALQRAETEPTAVVPGADAMDQSVDLGTEADTAAVVPPPFVTGEEPRQPDPHLLLDHVRDEYRTRRHKDALHYYTPHGTLSVSIQTSLDAADVTTLHRRIVAFQIGIPTRICEWLMENVHAAMCAYPANDIWGVTTRNIFKPISPELCIAGLRKFAAAYVKNGMFTVSVVQEHLFCDGNTEMDLHTLPSPSKWTGIVVQLGTRRLVSQGEVSVQTSLTEPVRGVYYDGVVTPPATPPLPTYSERMRSASKPDHCPGAPRKPSRAVTHCFGGPQTQ